MKIGSALLVDRQTGLRVDWLRALARAGYRGLPAGDQLRAQPRQAAQRLLLWRWLFGWLAAAERINL